jgi:YgiT-type zinc finger domain-containing protein
MKCLICRQAVTVDEPASIKFQRGETGVVVNNVPAWNCPNCGEGYLDEDVVMRLLRNMEKRSRAGTLQGEIEYEGL